jgi:hypothetical protein
MDSLRPLYYETHIVPTEQDFIYQLNNHDWMYLVLYWLNKEHLYPLFVYEEMDIDIMRMMNEQDLRYFHMDQCEIFKRWIRL